MILDSTRLSEENKIEKVSISVKKDRDSNILLLCKKKFYQDISTIADFLAAVIVKQYNEKILSIFESCY